MGKKQISTGEVAKISGLTIRTLQHYDNIGVLPASGRTEGGRRFYTESDMIKLEHIIFYRGLGFSLDQIKRILVEPKTDKNAAAIAVRTCGAQCVETIKMARIKNTLELDEIYVSRALWKEIENMPGAMPLGEWKAMEFSECGRAGAF